MCKPKLGKVPGINLGLSGRRAKPSSECLKWGVWRLSPVFELSNHTYIILEHIKWIN